ncbi:hypothetical protein SISSUDRAFT_995508, partial [Sistotremastrum suecicum HHB10207 ss-3]
LEYLPPYSPDLNPIEESFSCFKAWIKRNNAEVRAAMDESTQAAQAMLGKAYVLAVDGEKAEGWFGDSGYLFE